MNYPESLEILKRIKGARSILLNCHHNPDADSVGSSLGLAYGLIEMGKSIKVICPSSVPKRFDFLTKKMPIDVVDFSSFDYSCYDLFITLDSSSWNRVSGGTGIKKADIFMICIDHHKTNQKYADINLVAPDISSTSELLYQLYLDWGIDIFKLENAREIATCLFTGILGDTGGLRYAEANEKTYEIASTLMKVASKDEIVFNLFQRYELNTIYYWAYILSKIRFNEKGKFVYAFINKEEYQKYGKIEGAKGELADIFFSSIEGSEFGLIVVEEGEGNVVLSLRSRSGFDVSEIASRLGGGGHRWAAAGRIVGMSFEESKTKIFNTIYEIYGKYQKK